MMGYAANVKEVTSHFNLEGEAYRGGGGGEKHMHSLKRNWSPLRKLEEL